MPALETENTRSLKFAAAPELEPATDSALFHAFTWPGKLDLDAAVEYEYTEADLASMTRGKAHYDATCAMCHQNNGRGVDSLAPQLTGSEWGTGPKQTLALIVGQGLTGPVEVNGQTWNLTMPPHGLHPALQGESFNDLLNYLRSGWGNNASPFQPGEARGYLERFASRTQLWTAEEPQKLPAE